MATTQDRNMLAACTIGLGCMRLPNEEPLLAALRSGIRLLDTAHAYPGNETLIAQALRTWGGPRPTVITKGGLNRDGDAWKHDARAATLSSQCEASLRALGQIDLYLLHAPDPKVPLKTSVRALARLKEQGLVAAIGLSNVTLPQLLEACEVAPIAAVQIALGAFHQAPFRSGLVRHCLRQGIAVLAHTPLGGVARAKTLSKQPELRRVAERHGISAPQAVLSWLVDLGVIPLPGARRVETAGQLKSVPLTETDRAELDARFTAAARALRPPSRRAASDREVILIMGIPGAGKSTVVQQWAERGYRRLNRDERGGTLAGLASALDDELRGGLQRAVLDNTYVTRAQRDPVLEVAERHGATVRCVFLDTPLEQAEINVVERARNDGLLPSALWRMARQLEPPTSEEGFASVERVSFVRRETRAVEGTLVFVDSVSQVAEWKGPALVLGWRPAVVPAVPAGVELAFCPHEGGPPRCWCRPPFPGLAVEWAKRHDVSLGKSTLYGRSAAAKKMAAALGCRWVDTAAAASSR